MAQSFAELDGEDCVGRRSSQEISSATPLFQGLQKKHQPNAGLCGCLYRIKEQ